MLIRSNESLINIGKRFGFDTAQIEEWQQQSLSAYNTKLWNDSLNSYTGYDIDVMTQLAEDLGVDITPRVKLLSVTEPPARAAGVKVASVAELIEKLRNEAKVI